MQFSKEFLKEVIKLPVQLTQIFAAMSYIHYECIFEYELKLYRVFYQDGERGVVFASTGATVECEEVEPIEVKVIHYVAVRKEN